MSQIKYINLADLQLPDFEAHKLIDKNQISEIADSIKEIGIIEPLIIRKVDKHLEIVAGCIRYRAAKLAGLKALPCIIMSLEDEHAEILKLHENIKRVDLDHIDQGQTFIMMQSRFGMTEEAISKSSGKSIAYVSQHISLVNQYPDLSNAVKQRTLSFSQARELFQVKDKHTRNQLMLYCQRDGATIEVLKSWIKEHNEQLSSTTPIKESDNHQEFKYIPVKDFRICEACGAEVLLGQIRQVFYCPPCHNALKQAIDEEKSKQQ
ncbi:Nucleoid occlusion protein [subsurface metagenome]